MLILIRLKINSTRIVGTYIIYVFFYTKNSLHEFGGGFKSCFFFALRAPSLNASYLK